MLGDGLASTLPLTQGLPRSSSALLSGRSGSIAEIASTLRLDFHVSKPSGSNAKLFEPYSGTE